VTLTLLGVFVEMTEFDRTRRRFLANTALTGFGLTAAMRAAHAFSRQPMNVEDHKAYQNACTGAADPYHAQLVAQAQAELGGRMTIPEIEQAVAVMQCPVCGCALAPARLAGAKAG
jgi:hypothetical protein